MKPAAFKKGPGVQKKGENLHRKRSLQI